MQQLPATLDPHPTYLSTCLHDISPCFLSDSNIWNGNNMKVVPPFEDNVFRTSFRIKVVLSQNYCRLTKTNTLVLILILISNLSLEGFYFIVKAHRYKYEIKIVTESGLYKSCHIRLQSFFSFDLLASCRAIASLTLSSLVARGSTGLPLRGNESPRFGGWSPLALL